MVTVIARYRAKADRGPEVAMALGKHLVATRKEPGCVQFLVYRSRSDGDRFLLYEQYDDAAAFEAHRASDHFKQYVEGTIVPLLAEREWDSYDEVLP